MHEHAGDDFGLYTNPPLFVTRTTFRWQAGMAHVISLEGLVFKRMTKVVSTANLVAYMHAEIGAEPYHVFFSLGARVSMIAWTSFI